MWIVDPRGAWHHLGRERESQPVSGQPCKPLTQRLKLIGQLGPLRDDILQVGPLEAVQLAVGGGNHGGGPGLAQEARVGAKALSGIELAHVPVRVACGEVGQEVSLG